MTGVVVMLQYERAATPGWVDLGPATSDSDGFVTSVRRPSASMRFRLISLDGQSTSGPSGYVTVRATISAAWATARTTIGTQVDLAGAVRPARIGSVRIQRYVGHGAWRTIATVAVTSTGGYRWRYRAVDRTDPVIRVYRPADSAHPAAFSAARTLVVS